MAASAAPVPQGAASAPAAAPASRRRIARWRPPVAVAAVVIGLVGGQALALVPLLVFGGSEPNVWDGIGLLLADAFLIAVIVFFARKGARLSAYTLGIRKTRFWPAVGWSAAFFVASIWEIPLALIGAVTVSVLLLLPFARERAPQAVKA